MQQFLSVVILYTNLALNITNLSSLYIISFNTVSGWRPGSSTNANARQAAGMQKLKRRFHPTQRMQRTQRPLLSLLAFWPLRLLLCVLCVRCARCFGLIQRFAGTTRASMRTWFKISRAHNATGDQYSTTPNNSVSISPNSITPTFTETSPRGKSWTQITKVADKNHLDASRCLRQSPRQVRDFDGNLSRTLSQSRCNGIWAIWS